MNNQQLIKYLHGRGLVGGAGSKEATKNNAYTQFNIRNKQKGYTRDELRTAYYNNPMADLPIKNNLSIIPQITTQNNLLPNEYYAPYDLSNISDINNDYAPVPRIQPYGIADVNDDNYIIRSKNAPARKQTIKKQRTMKSPPVAEIRAMAKASGHKLSRMVAGKRKLYTKGELMAFLNLI